MNYKDLDVGKYGLPRWDATMPLIMEVALQQKEWKRMELIGAVADELQLPDHLRNLRYEKYPDEYVVDGRISWAMSDLAIAGLLDRPKRGVYVATALGKSIYEKYGLKLNSEITHQQNQFIIHQKEQAERKSALLSKQETQSTELEAEDGEISSQSALASQIKAQVAQYNADIADELLSRIRSAEPEFFEHLVVKLLAKMGYQGSNGNVTVTPIAHDGGIDGIINQDPLGTRTVYLQAKRYQAGNVVQRQAIDSFWGALSRIRADRGVFITTSSFSKSAIQTAEQFSIVLINGVQLTDLMLQYHVGVQTREQMELVSIDEEYFEVE